MNFKYYILIILFCLSANTYAQDLKDKFLIESCTIEVSKNSLLPTSVIVEGYKDFKIDNNKVILSDCIIGDSVYISYRTFDFNIEDVYHTSIKQDIQERERSIKGQDYTIQKQKDGIIDAENLLYNGSFSRGFSIGNQQDLLLNSKFNLTMYGDLGDGLQIKAAISDDNIPIQPEGNTQVLNEFDKVFIEISKDSSKLIAGDYMLQEDSYFKKYIKKLQGLSVQNTSMLSTSASIKSEGNFAVSRGKYARQKINIAEGNLGPYRLTGNNNERFLIVLSGTERVFIDNILQVRGFDQDYTIDYNRAEITFTPNKFIGPENNIIVEYEYRDQNYLRSLYTAQVEYNNEKWTIGTDFYNEQDSKNVIGDRKLDSLDISRMANIGDNIDNAFISTIYNYDAAPTASTITYTKVPTSIPQDTISYFLEYSTDKSRELVQAVFSNVGQEKGRYAIDNNNIVNGRVYKYVGKNKGSYEPISKLIPPIKRQMATVYGTYRNGYNSWTSADIALSTTDLNRYATAIDNKDNRGWAGHLETHQQLFKNDNNTLTLSGNIEIDSKNFKSFTRYRDAEFSRNWNIGNPEQQLEQQLYSTHFNYKYNDRIDITQGLEHYLIDGYYSGLRNISNAIFSIGNTKLVGQYDYLNATENVLNNRFERPLVSVEQVFSKAYNFRAKAQYFKQKNTITNRETRTLSDQSFGLEEYSFNTQISPTKNSSLGIDYAHKTNLRSDKKRLTEAYHTEEYLFNAKTGNESNYIKANLGIRNLYVDNSDLSPSNEKRSLISKIDYQFSAWKKGLKSSLSFTTTSGQEPKQEVVYERVEPGQGNYIYIGNADSTLVAGNFRYAEELGNADYIRINLFNDEFISVNNQTYLQNIRTDFKKLFPKAAIISKLSSVHRININRKSQDLSPEFWDQFNVFKIGKSIVTYTSGISNTVFFNKGKRGYDISLGSIYNNSIFTQISGLETRKNLSYKINARHQIGKKSDILLGLKNGHKTYTSTLFEDRGFDISIFSITPSFRFIPSQKFKWAAGYTYQKQEQQINNLESSINHSINSNITYRYNDKSNLTSSLTYSFIEFDGERNSIIEFEMINGLKKGKNYEWEILYTQRLQNNVDLNISYRGRKSESSPFVHIGRMQVKASF